jgi:hypothetical protein
MRETSQRKIPGTPVQPLKHRNVVTLIYARLQLCIEAVPQSGKFALTMSVLRMLFVETPCSDERSRDMLFKGYWCSSEVVTITDGKLKVLKRLNKKSRYAGILIRKTVHCSRGLY